MIEEFIAKNGDLIEAGHDDVLTDVSKNVTYGFQSNVTPPTVDSNKDISRNNLN